MKINELYDKLYTESMKDFSESNGFDYDLTKSSRNINKLDPIHHYNIYCLILENQRREKGFIDTITPYSLKNIENSGVVVEISNLPFHLQKMIIYYEKTIPFKK